MSTEKAFGPFEGVVGGGEGEDGAGEKECLMEVIGRGLFGRRDDPFESRHELICC